MEFNLSILYFAHIVKVFPLYLFCILSKKKKSIINFSILSFFSIIIFSILYAIWGELKKVIMQEVILAYNAGGHVSGQRILKGTFTSVMIDVGLLHFKASTYLICENCF